MRLYKQFTQFFVATFLLAICCPLNELTAQEQQDSSETASQSVTQQSASDLLTQIKTQIEEHTTQLLELRTQQKSLEKSLGELQRAVQSIKDRRATVVDEIEQTKKLLEEINLKVDQTRKSEAASAKVAAERLRAIYMQRGAEQGQVLVAAAFSNGRLSDSRTAIPLSTQATYLKAIERYDAETVLELANLRTKLAEETGAAERLAKDRTVLEAKLKQEETSLKVAVAKQSALVTDARKQREEVENSLDSLRKQAQRLETVVASLTGAQPQIADPGTTHILPREEPQEPYSGAGLAGLKGKLIAPVSGRISRKFGKHRVADLKEYVFNKGITFSVTPPAEVYAIAPGRVIFEGRMPVYGMVVILDHGDRYYSLYGGLSYTEVVRGDEVPARALVGSVQVPTEDPSSTSNLNFSLHFEIRKNGEPVNPIGFLRR